jgi:orotate phosphoribosyltransferase
MVAAMGFYKVFMDLGNFASSPFISAVTAAFQIPPDGDFSIIFAVAAGGLILTGIIAIFVCARIKPINISQNPDKQVESPVE